MRKILIALGILIAFIVATLATWIFGGRHISLFLDRFGTIEMNSARINSIAYEGSGTGGSLRINDLRLSLNDRNGPTPSVGTTKNDQLALANLGKVFPFGSARTEAENLIAVPPAGDDASIPIRRSRSGLANAIRFQFHDRPVAIVETPFVLSATLEKAFRCKARNVVAL
jgi:hypothetical protein